MGRRPVTCRWYLVAAACTLLSCARAGATAQSCPEASVRPVSIPQRGSSLLRDAARSAQLVGAGKLQMLAFQLAGVGDQAADFVAIPKSRCALLLARGSAGIADIDLYVHADDGTEYGVDEAPDDLPTLLICPQESTRLFVSARVAQGKGLLAVGVLDVPPDRIDAVSQLVGVRKPGQATAPPLHDWPGLETELARHRESIGGRWRNVRQVALPVDARIPTSVSIQVPPQRCLDALVVPEAAVNHIELSAFDEAGRIFRRAEPVGRHPYLVLCSGSEGATVSLSLRPHAHQGTAVLVLGTTLEESDRFELRVTPAKVPGSGALVSGEDGLALRTPPTWRLPLQIGTRHSIDLSLNGCAQFLLQEHSGLQGVAVWVWDDLGQLVAEAPAPLTAEFFACANSKLRLDAEAKVVAGDLHISKRPLQISMRDQKVLVELPLAANRLLQILRLAAPGPKWLTGANIQRHALAPATMARSNLTLPAGVCGAVVIAKQGMSFGLEARLIDQNTGLELDFARAGHALRVRACASDDADTAVVLEVRTTSRPDDALVAQVFYAADTEPVVRP